MELSGEGTYMITNVKQFKVTEDFLTLDSEIKDCQNEEPFDECTTKMYFAAITNICKCVPYGLRNFSSSHNMDVSLNIVRQILENNTNNTNYSVSYLYR